MRIIGVDPGSVCCGYGIIEVSNFRSQISNIRYITSGDIRMNKSSSLPDRLMVLYDSLKRIVGEYKPQHLCLERLFYHKGITSAFTLGSTRGIVMLVAAEMGMPVFEYNPTKVKMALTGYGRADKRQVKEMVKRLLNLNSPDLRLSEDTTDALALCICHVNNGLKA
ncbi:MAG: crossover junction endodeoxyribonuclease RuvC [Thermodesulfovibrionia bacterium]